MVHALIVDRLNGGILNDFSGVGPVRDRSGAELRGAAQQGRSMQMGKRWWWVALVLALCPLWTSQAGAGLVRLVPGQGSYDLGAMADVLEDVPGRLRLDDVLAGGSAASAFSSHTGRLSRFGFSRSRSTIPRLRRATCCWCCAPLGSTPCAGSARTGRAVMSNDYWAITCRSRPAPMPRRSF